MKKKIILCCMAVISLLSLPKEIFSQNVGIGTTTPLARLHVTDSSVLFSAVNNVPVTAVNPPLEGPGRRMMWYPDKAAFRVGYVTNNEWDKNNIGTYSFASGWRSIASGVGSVALGYGASASGDYSIALGNSRAAGIYSAAPGGNGYAAGDYSFASGYLTTASGYNSTAMGYLTSASGNLSTALGGYSVASGYNSTAMGYTTTASGSYSTTIGNYVSTTGFNGAFALGDNSTTTVMQSFVANGFRSRFAGGYRLLTNSAATLGVVLLPDGGSWSAISDVRLKENFLPVNAENILKKIASLPLTTWNYTEQSRKTSRHYGPMAQDFYKAFGHDELGVIGCDTLINQQDFLGVNLIAIQALEKRTQKITLLEKESAELRKQNEALLKRIERLETLLTSKK